MAQHLFIFGMGYTSQRLASALRRSGWHVTGTRREADGENIAFGDHASVKAALASASHILSSVPPDRSDGSDPVLSLYGEPLKAAGARWVCYLSATGVYGDTAGAWADESAPIGGGRRSERSAADAEWQALRADMRILRLPGIYGPGRSALDRVRSGKGRRIDLPGQVFSRIHVDDIISAVIASFAGPPGIFNISDDLPCAQNLVIEAACDLLGKDYPPMQSLADAQLSPMAQAFYSENRRIANMRAKRLLGWQPLYPSYREGLFACLRDEIQHQRGKTGQAD